MYEYLKGGCIYKGGNDYGTPIRGLNHTTESTARQIDREENAAKRARDFERNYWGF